MEHRHSDFNLLSPETKFPGMSECKFNKETIPEIRLFSTIQKIYVTLAVGRTGFIVAILAVYTMSVAI